VAKTPEEIVRQSLLHKMLGSLGYPKSLIAVEKELSSTHRRFDIVCFTPDPKHGGLSPLLVVECKAEKMEKEALQQAMGYNSFLHAPFICIVCNTLIRTFWMNQDRIESVDFLPAYQELLKMKVM
jgi:hypothetical protein